MRNLDNAIKVTPPGMLKKRTINIIVVDNRRGTGIDSPQTFNKSVQYSGKKAVVKF